MRHTDEVLPHEIRFGRPSSLLRNSLERKSQLFAFLCIPGVVVPLLMLFKAWQTGEDSPGKYFLPALVMTAFVGIICVLGKIHRNPRMWLVVNDRGLAIGYWARPQSWDITWSQIDHVSVFRLSSAAPHAGKYVLVIRPRRSIPWFSAPPATDPVSSHFRFINTRIHQHFWYQGYLAMVRLDNVAAHPEVLREAVETFGGPDRYRTEAELCALNPRLKP